MCRTPFFLQFLSFLFLYHPCQGEFIVFYFFICYFFFFCFVFFRWVFVPDVGHTEIECHRQTYIYTHKENCAYTWHQLCFVFACMRHRFFSSLLLIRLRHVSSLQGRRWWFCLFFCLFVLFWYEWSCTVVGILCCLFYLSLRI